MNYWSNIADLFSGLMMIFLFIAIGILIDVNKDAESLEKETAAFRAVSEKRESVRREVYIKLKKEFSGDFESWNASLGEDLSISFSNPEVLFSDGSSDLNDKYKKILESFFPRYIDIVMNYKSDIEYVAIEGHTSSSGWTGCQGDCSYFRNMDLSQKRSLRTLEHCWSLTDYKMFVMDKIVATGMSYSKRLESEGGYGYDEEGSKRVEFSIKIKSDFGSKNYENTSIAYSL